MRKLYSIAIAIVFFISACTKIESTTIGSGLIPPIDGVTTLDTTLDVYTNNYIDPLGDSAKVYKSDDHVIGVINNDPLFGKTTASAFFELKPTSYPFSFPNTESSFKADSAVLILSYRGVFGDTLAQQKWEVRELAEPLRGDTVFTVSKSFATGSVLGTKTIDIPRLKDSVNYGFENASNQIRIKLDPSFALKLMTQFDSVKNGAAYSNDSLFRQSFKGFAVMPSTGSNGNALIRINLLDTNTKLALFYNYHIKDSVPDKRSATVAYFRFSSGSGTPVSGNGNYIKRERGGQLTQFTSTTSAARNDSLVFIQTMPGTFATVKIPGLRGFPNVLVHRAELLAFQAPELPPYNGLFAPPRYLLLSSYDSVNKVLKNVPNDFIISGGTPNISTFGGFVMDREAPGSGIVKTYNFDLSRYVQGIISRKDSSYTLRLSAPSNDSLHYTPPYPQPNTVSTFFVAPSVSNNQADGRVRLGGGGMTGTNQLRMRLRIVYSKI